MARVRATAGQLLINEILPPDMRDYNRKLDKKGLARLLSELADKHPELYRDVSFRLGILGRRAAYATGGYSFGLEHMRRAKSAIERRKVLNSKLDALLNDNSIDDEARDKKTLALVGQMMEQQADEILNESAAEGNPLALQLQGAGRGNKFNLASLRGSDGLYQDHRGRIIPIPVLRSYAQGLSPLEYWAGTYGARQGVMSVKFCIGAETPVLMGDLTTKPISAVRPGDVVWTVDEDNKLTRTAVKRVFANGPKPCSEFYFREGRSQELISVTATNDHKAALCWRDKDSIVSAMLPLGQAVRRKHSAIVPSGVRDDDGFDEPRAGLVGLLLGAGGLTQHNTNCGDDLPRCYVCSEDRGLVETYDIEVEHPSHRFVLGNLLVVSNSTQDAGYLSKQLNQIAHRAVVLGDDEDEEPDTLRGLPVETDDDDSEGALLAAPAGKYKRNTILTPKILRELRESGVKKILVRSPISGGTPDGGLYARDVGVREFGRLPTRGENVGLAAAQALSEPISQGQLSAKHTGGVAGQSKAVSGFDFINQLVQVPKTFKAGAAHATVDGVVQSVEPAPAGGFYATIDGTKHYIGSGYEPSIKKGDRVEAGDVISDGTPNPALITKYKGIGEGRRYFVKAFTKAIRDGGMNAHRRNVELLAGGLINHVRLTDEIGDFAPDDVVPYSVLAAHYRPRDGHRIVSPAQAVGRYLEKPYLHYTVGTKIQPSMLKDFTDFNVGNVAIHDDPPPFEPEMVRGMSNLQHDPDWMTRMFGSGLKSSLLRGVHRGGTSDEAGTSFVPSRARAVDFGRVGVVRTPEKPKPGQP